MEYFLTPDGKQYSHLLGGPCLYAGAGAKIWTVRSAGVDCQSRRKFSRRSWHLRSAPKGWISAACGSFHIANRPRDFIVTTNGINASTGIRSNSMRAGIFPVRPNCWITPRHRSARAKLYPFPEIAIRSEDIPNAYRQARAAYIAPCHYLSQITLSVALRQFGLGTICLAPSKGMYLPTNLPSIGQLLHGIDIFFAREET